MQPRAACVRFIVVTKHMCYGSFDSSSVLQGQWQRQHRLMQHGNVSSSLKAAWQRSWNAWKRKLTHAVALMTPMCQHLDISKHSTSTKVGMH